MHLPMYFQCSSCTRSSEVPSQAISQVQGKFHHVSADPSSLNDPCIDLYRIRYRSTLLHCLCLLPCNHNISAYYHHLNNSPVKLHGTAHKLFEAYVPHPVSTAQGNPRPTPGSPPASDDLYISPFHTRYRSQLHPYPFPF